MSSLCCQLWLVTGSMYLLRGLWIILRIWPGQVIICSSYPCSSPCPGTVTGITGPTSWLITPWHGSWPVSAHLVRGVVQSPLALSCLYHHVCFIQWAGKAPRGNSILSPSEVSIYLDCRLFFLSWTRDLWIFSPTLYHCATRGVGTHLWLLQVFNSGVRGICGRVFIWTVNYFLSWLVFEPGTFGSSVRHSTTVSPGVLVPTSDYFRYLTLGSEEFVVEYLFIWTVDFFFFLIGIWTRDLWIFSPTHYYYYYYYYWINFLIDIIDKSTKLIIYYLGIIHHIIKHNVCNKHFVH